jgi:hypothetical protein
MENGDFKTDERGEAFFWVCGHWVNAWTIQDMQFLREDIVRIMCEADWLEQAEEAYDVVKSIKL